LKVSKKNFKPLQRERRTVLLYQIRRTLSRGFPIFSFLLDSNGTLRKILRLNEHGYNDRVEKTAE